MTDKKEVSILLLGIVAILAIVGLVLLFTSPAATGRQVWELPVFPPSKEYAYGAGEVEGGGQFRVTRGGGGNAIYVQELTAELLPRCPNGDFMERMQGNIPYEQVPGYYCRWFFCSAATPGVEPQLACAPIPSPSQ